MPNNKEDMRRFIDWILILGILSVFILLSMNLVLMRENGTQCLMNPLSYGAQHFNDRFDFNFEPQGQLLGTSGLTSYNIEFNTTDTIIEGTKYSQ